MDSGEQRGQRCERTEEGKGEWQDEIINKYMKQPPRMPHPRRAPRPVRASPTDGVSECPARVEPASLFLAADCALRASDSGDGYLYPGPDAPARVGAPLRRLFRFLLVSCCPFARSAKESSSVFHAEMRPGALR
jgi:hypothetical protein